MSAKGLVYPSFESRAEIARLVAQREADAPWPRDPDGAPLYPGAAKSLSSDERARLLESGAPYALRLDMAAACARAGDLGWIEHGEGPDGETGAVAARPQAWGDVILARKETPTSYHLSVVIDDALQGVTEVVRGQDLFWSTSVHRLLQKLLGLPQPAYRHHRLVLDGAGRKLSKSTRGHGACGNSAPGVRRRPTSAAWSACLNSADHGRDAPVENLVRRDSRSPAVAWWAPARVGGIMAPKSRSQRTTRPPKKRPPKSAQRRCRRKARGKRAAKTGSSPAWSRRRWPPSRMRSARR